MAGSINFERARQIRLLKIENSRLEHERRAQHAHKAKEQREQAEAHQQSREEKRRRGEIVQEVILFD